MIRFGLAATAGLALLLAASGTQMAQAQTAQPEASADAKTADQAPSAEKDDDRGWGGWRERMHRWGGGPGMMWGWGGDAGPDDYEGGYGRRGWDGPGMRWGWHGGPGMMGAYGMGPWGGSRRGGWGPMHGGAMPLMMLSVLDTDDSGTISYEEFERLHRRMFEFMDENGDGELSPDELRPMMDER